MWWCGALSLSRSPPPSAASLSSLSLSAHSHEDSCSVYECYMRSFHPPPSLAPLAQAAQAAPEPEPALAAPDASLVSMENSNNATDGGRLFAAAPGRDAVFKLPDNELTFNGTLKHLQKLKPLVDPMKFEIRQPLASVASDALDYDEPVEPYEPEATSCDREKSNYASTDCETNGSDARNYETDSSRDVDDRLIIDEKTVDGSLYSSKDGKSDGPNRSGESLDTSYNSGVRSPDLFSDEDEDSQLPHIRLQEFLDKHETYDKTLVKKMEKTLSGVPPPPSVTSFNVDVSEMLKRYYTFLPIFNNISKPDEEAITSKTPKKLTSFIHVPADNTEETVQDKKDLSNASNLAFTFPNNSTERGIVDYAQNALNASDEARQLPELGSEQQAMETSWPDILKCRFHDVHYNLSSYSERVEYLAMRCSQRYISDEFASSLTVFSSGPQSPSSAQKRKALRVKMAQAKSPGRRLSHLARRRQAFCSAANIAEKTQSSSSKMVLIDKNFFPHRKLTHTNDRKSPRTKRTPGRKTPGKKTPGKKTPGKKLAGSSSKKKAIRRLVLNSESATRSQPTRETSRRALFQSPENARSKKIEVPTTTNTRAIKSKRALFGSPDESDSRSFDGTPNPGKRKLDMLDDSLESAGKCKLQKSLSFAGEVVKSHGYTALDRRATEVFSNGNIASLNALHKQKLLWAVSEALRAHGWRLGSPGFKEKASALARLTRRLLTLPAHAVRLNTPRSSTSDYMLRLTRQYVFAIIQGRPVEECFTEEQIRLANESSTKLTGYVSASAYQQLKTKPSTVTSNSLSQNNIIQSSKIKENTCDSVLFKTDHPKSATKNILQDKLVNIDSNSNSSFAVLEDAAIFKSNSMPPFKETPKKGVRRQISFDNAEAPPKR